MSSNRLRLDQIPARYHAQVVTQLATRKDNPAPMPSMAESGKKRLRQSSTTPNKTEAAFFAWLQVELPFHAHHFQSITLTLANGVRYTPDAVSFGAANCIPRVVAWEVKGGFMRDDAGVKLKCAARAFPSIDFRLMTSSKTNSTGWDMQVILP